MRLPCRSAIAVSLFGLGFLGCAVESDSAQEQAFAAQLAIEGGSVDKTSSNVVGISIGGQGTCTGSLIAPNLVLTAQHCVAQLPSNTVSSTDTFGSVYSAQMFTVSTNYNMESGSGRLRVSKVSVGKVNGKAWGDDIAALTLTTNIAESVAKPLIPRVDQPVVMGEKYTAIGFGETEFNQGDAGIRYSLPNLSVKCPSRTSSCTSSAKSGLGDGDWAGQRTSVWRGDSGGPALDAQRRVIGVVSRGSPGTEPVYSGISKWSSWIKKVALEAAATGKYEAPSDRLNNFEIPNSSSCSTTRSDGSCKMMRFA